MMTELYESIAEGLKAVKKCHVYLEGVPQNFRVPAFLVSIYSQEPSGGINGRLKNSVGFDVMYYPEKVPGAVEECWGMAEEMNRYFCIPGFRTKNRNSKIEDDVLHYMFDVDYREYREDSTDRMQVLLKRTGIKED